MTVRRPTPIACTPGPPRATISTGAVSIPCRCRISWAGASSCLSVGVSGRAPRMIWHAGRSQEPKQRAIAIALCLGSWERPACQIMRGARPLTPTERQLLAPAHEILQRQGMLTAPVEIVARGGPGVQAMGVGRRTVIVSSGLLDAARGQLLPADEIAAVLAHATGLTLAGRVRNCLLYTSPSPRD